MPGDVLVVGGYGAVGRVVSTRLVADAPGRVVAAGRTAEKAKRFAASVEGLRPGVADTDAPETFDDVLDGVSTVVVCLDQGGPAFAAACLERGIDYVDVSPTDTHLREIEALDNMARETGASGVLSVGLSPGMTNLFVAESAGALETVDRADITLLLGVGESFGPDSLEWTVGAASTDFAVKREGRRTPVQAFTDPRTVVLSGWGRRRAYRANLADQHVLARTTDIPSVETRLCYDSRLLTEYVAATTRHGLARPFVSLVGADRLASLIDRAPFGAAESVVQTEVVGTANGRRKRFVRWVRGPNQARATALVATTTVRRLWDDGTSAGVGHLHELFAPDRFVTALREAGYAVGREEAPPV
ncbi:saccharopine dehydrogenase NADP-binding domain-containing protein (plasmid) [Haladaptatus sp. SPP-AMP-3]|uniref:saccharopine dehydrogenase family protein n=1 Tax=Haladaptatus sp. SPP-AMP-3 TaxID=3121295 RepID=UPI003C2DFDAC